MFNFYLSIKNKFEKIFKTFQKDKHLRRLLVEKSVFPFSFLKSWPDQREGLKTSTSVY